ncbi:hypothetical protein [Thiocapsa roseopersicina]|uniref:Uncharacterized protein n=1 Tax=Thiocapsa roseopersicina TaxID=1058 RepID=A0A1H2R1T4_THIRO|nr:hypothetical protein [Thiocapsa roseopersicina]SDW13341.1 hypothetical protein SAMN05421783_101507 [Thiocapsa roseopersicina]
MMTLQTSARPAPGLPTGLTLSIPIGEPASSGSLGSASGLLAAVPSVGDRITPAKLIEMLQALLTSDLDAAARLRFLRAWKAPLLASCEHTGAHVGEETGERPMGSGSVFEGRLYRLMFRNLAAAIELTANRQRAPDADLSGWAVRNLFHFFQYQIRHAARLQIPLPAGSWRDLHALSVRLVVSTRYPRSVDASRDAYPVVGYQGIRSIELRYKEILLLGLIAQVFVNAIQDRMSGLSSWAVETRLETPFGLSGQRGLWLVDLADDAPPCECAGPLSPDFRGWVLFPPLDFVRMLDSARLSETSDRGRAVRPSPF